MGTGGARNGSRDTPETRTKGAIAEMRVLSAFRHFALPWWIRKVRRARRHEDRKGVDVVIETVGGRMFLQVKSSRRGAEDWLRAHALDRRPIAVIVVSSHCELATIYGRALGALILIRERQQSPATVTSAVDAAVTT